MLTNLTPQAAPLLDPALNIPYELAVNYVRTRLCAFAHGGLKRWVTQLTPPAPSYNYIVALKNDTLLKISPQPVQRLLQELGFFTHVLKGLDEEGNTQFSYQFSDQDAFDLFQDQQRLLVENMSGGTVGLG